MRNGRTLRLFRDLGIGSTVCLVAAVLAPLSVWQSLGATGVSLVSLAAATTVTAVAVLHVHSSGETKIEPAPAKTAV